MLICGPAGIGKTSFLQHAAVERVLSADAVPDCAGLLWPTVQGANPKEVLRDLALRCTNAKSAAALRFLGTLHALVVLDGVDWSPTQLGVLLDAMPESVFVISSRTAVLSPLSRPLPLGGLSAKAAGKLMKNELGRRLTDEEQLQVERIRVRCDGNPTELVQIGAAVRAAPRNALSEHHGADGAHFIVPRLLATAGEPASALLRTLLVFPELSWGEELLRTTAEPALDGATELVDRRLVLHEAGRYRVAHNVAGVVSPLEDEDVTVLFDQITGWIAEEATSGQVVAELAVVEGVLRRMLEEHEHRSAVHLARITSARLLPSLWWDRGDRVLRLGLLAARQGGSSADELYFRKALAIRRAADRQLEEALRLTSAAAMSAENGVGTVVDGARDPSAVPEAQGVTDVAEAGSGGAGEHLRHLMANAAARFSGSPAMVNITSVVQGTPVLVRAAALGTAALAVCGAAVLGSQSADSQTDAAPTTNAVTGTRNASLPLLPGAAIPSSSTGSASATASSGAQAPSDVPSAEVGVPAPDTVASGADPTAGQTVPDGGTGLVRNAGFDEPSGTGPTSVTGGAPGKPAGGKSAAADWAVYNNSNGGTTTTELVPSTGPGGGQMLRLCTTQPSNEVFQYFATKVGVGPTEAVVEVWVYVERGRVGVGIGDGGSTSLRGSSGKQGQWELLRASSGGDPATEVVIAAIAADTCFSVDSVSTRP